MTAPELRVEHSYDGFGVAVSEPRLSWHPTSPGPWEISATWPDGSSEVVLSHTSLWVPWPFRPLASRGRCAVRVRAVGQPWSAVVDVEASLLSGEWKGSFVGGATYLRREFEVVGVERARVYATALGVYELELNGERVSDRLFAPGWTPYDKRLRFQAYDVTGLLRPGRNAIGATLADGWWRGHLGWNGDRAVYGDHLALLVQLEIDGVPVLTTDASWRCAEGPLLSADLYLGESYDARLAQPGWAAPGFDDSGWAQVSSVPFDFDLLVPQAAPAVMATSVVSPIGVGARPDGRWVLDFGQNLVGRVRFEGLKAPAGTTVTLRHAEVLADGELCTEPLRRALQTDRYTSSGQGVESWEPRFTQHGFRYVEVSGWPGPLGSFTAQVTHSEMPLDAWFRCSSDLVNRLHDNARWSLRGNFVDVPTDCPQRDERLGWTGDIALFAPAATTLSDCGGFLSSWLEDLALEQLPTGELPVTVPSLPSAVLGVPEFGPSFAAVWSDAAVVVPWTLYERCGDLALLQRQWPSMELYGEGLARTHAEGIAAEVFQFGDWLDPGTDDPFGRTPLDLIAGACLVRVMALLAASAEALGKDPAPWRSRELRFSERWRRDFAPGPGSTTTALALAICYELVENPSIAGDLLADKVRENGFRMDTGFVGTPLVLDALVASGHADEAFAMLLCTEPPSYLNNVLQGATTMWERWDSVQADGAMTPSNMNSCNHYASGAVADWLYRTVGGISPLEPAYRLMRIAPVPGPLTSADVCLMTPYGQVTCCWTVEGDRIDVRVVVPPCTEAELDLPISGWTVVRVRPGTYRHTGQVSHFAGATCP